MGHYQVLPLQVRVDQGTIAMKRYTTSSEAPALMEPHHNSLISYPGNSLGGGVLSLCWDAVSVFYSPSQLSQMWFCPGYLDFAIIIVCKKSFLMISVKFPKQYRMKFFILDLPFLWIFNSWPTLQIIFLWVV